MMKSARHGSAVLLLVSAEGPRGLALRCAVYALAENYFEYVRKPPAA